MAASKFSPFVKEGKLKKKKRRKVTEATVTVSEIRIEHCLRCRLRGIPGT